ncbi:MAG: histidine kinase [Betaproteobacteria bacterium HGW-Betaproteobacteria-22]|nr:MAG: histidine kinase [Betaproteobacteria bacterium HGW-Betaproteobacteria-22]
MSLRFRLNLLITLLSLAFIMVVGTILVSDTRVSIRERVEAANRVTVQLLDTVIVSSALNPEMGPTHLVLQSFLLSLGYVRSSHIVLYDYEGRALYSSPDSTFKIDVVPPEWFVKLVAPKEEREERIVRFGKLVITSSSSGSVREAWSGFSQIMWVGLVFFIVLNAMVYLLLSHSLRPINKILAAINRIEHGDLTTRLPKFSLPDFDRIGHSLNRMAESLNAERLLEENRQLTQLIQKHIEDERRSLARELHDELGQYVTAIKTFAVGIGNRVKANANASELKDISSSAQVIVSAANQIYDGMHNIIRQLRPGALDNLGLAETLKDLVSSYQMQHPQIKMQFHLSDNLELTHTDAHVIGETVSINLYRIVQEALNNTIKYAQASAINISLSKSATGELSLIIQDDGVGMDVCAVDQTKHFGLLGMRERVQALNGVFDIVTAPDAGTTIDIKIPTRAID